MNSRRKGSLAIEAAISFSVFMCFMFMLMVIVKLSMVYITINDVTAETAKRIAGMSYPISYVNDFYDEKESKIKEITDVENLSFKGLSLANKKDGRVNSVAQSFKLNVTNKAMDITGIQSILNEVKDNFIDNVLDNVEKFYFTQQQELICGVYMDLIEASEMPINTDNINIVYFALPMSKAMFDNQKAYIAEKTGIKEEDLCKDDVVLVVEYDYTVAVPFFNSYDVKLKSIAVERAWLNGGNHETPSKKEGIDITGLLGRTVYYTSSGDGAKYHKADCMTLKRSGANKKSTTISGAKSMKLEPCKLCRPNVSD